MAESTGEIQNTQVAPAQAEAPAQEKLLKQSEVNEIVGRAKQDAYVKGKQDAIASSAPAQPVAQPVAMVQPHQVLTPDMARQIAAEEAQKQNQVMIQQAIHQRVANEFVAKLEAGKSKYPDFDEKVALLDLPKNLAIVHLANETDNTADVIKDIADNPSKMLMLNEYAKSNPALARSEMQKLSLSIKANQQAAQKPSPDTPLSQIKASDTSTGNGKMSIQDFQAQPWLRG